MKLLGISWYNVKRKYNRFLKSLIMLVLIISVSEYSSVSAVLHYPSDPSIDSLLISKTSMHLLLIIIAVLIIICFGIIFFTVRLKRINIELRNRNKKTEENNSVLQKTNKELEDQNNLIAREYYESDKFFSNLMKSADDGISFYDREWNLKYANSAFYSVIGYDRETYNSTDVADIIHPDDHDYTERRERGLKYNGVFISELRLKHIEGYYITLSTRSVTVMDDTGELLGALTISRDITKLKQVHQDLLKANEEAEASNRLKSSFLANISHEIRTPLNSVVGFSNLLLNNDITNEVKEEYVQHINYNSEKLLQIIGDIIDLSRLESSQIEITYEESSICEIVKEVAEEARKDIRRNEKSIILNVQNQFEENYDLIFTDRVWLKRVLSHIMDNAVKFTLDGSIAFSYFKENEDLIFSIKDTGIGIGKENLKNIFKEFRQEIEGHHRPFEGLGIGLTLAKEVIDRMGGKITVESEKGIGSEFRFSIPYRPAGSTKARTKKLLIVEEENLINWSSSKCLIVDDNKDVLIYLNRILLDSGIKTITARTGREAIKIIKEIPDLDIVILDMQMPEMDGIEVTREIRKIRNNLPIIAQTAFIFEDDKDIILQAGCDACLIKPIRKEHLLTMMSSFLKSN